MRGLMIRRRCPVGMLRTGTRRGPNLIAANEPGVIFTLTSDPHFF